jgi:hypothetical protein
MIDSVPGVDPARRARLLEVLDIDPAWRMHQVSDGQRRRVQICVGLLRPFKVGRRRGARWPTRLGRGPAAALARRAPRPPQQGRPGAAAAPRPAPARAAPRPTAPPLTRFPFHSPEKHPHPTPNPTPPHPHPTPPPPHPTPPQPQVLLLDEITVDLDVLGRADLMAFLAEECETRGATIIYATHIFDGLEAWPTHVAYVARGAARGAGRRGLRWS